jgi:hypothetical protein
VPCSGPAEEPFAVDGFSPESLVAAGAAASAAGATAESMVAKVKAASDDSAPGCDSTVGFFLVATISKAATVSKADRCPSRRVVEGADRVLRCSPELLSRARCY